MKKIIILRNEYNSLDTLYNYFKNKSTLDCAKEYDKWEMRTEDNGRIAQCIVLKKSGMHAIKLHFVEDNTVKINHVIPNSVMNAYFGKSQEARQNIIEIITGKIKSALLASSQQKAFQ
ncbi:hypothetical protein P8625_14035 [Tenacibaculum tangerinum]|uniref:Uncharacterized protein n=1 Tax=Tenacibaculum tangerinum TaxID=3038772 RepID=A0ABY8L134_9FLAO|nr:hypothetical protein [Tenacibaculum tangerinum]WGH75176.1 hypothetical protein P8625_14035 [Tenacibaculum tangerinum]